MFDTDDGCTDDLPISFSFGEILSSDLGPEDLCSMKNFEFVCSVDLNFMGDVGAINDGGVVFIAGLDVVDSFVDVGVLVHGILIYIFFRIRHK